MGPLGAFHEDGPEADDARDPDLFRLSEPSVHGARAQPLQVCRLREGGLKRPCLSRGGSLPPLQHLVHGAGLQVAHNLRRDLPARAHLDGLRGADHHHLFGVPLAELLVKQLPPLRSLFVCERAEAMHALL